MQGVDLRRYAFDYDLTAAILCLHPDGTVLARYGARGRRDSMELNTLSGLRKTLERALLLYASYPENRARLVAKSLQATDRTFAHAEDIPVPAMQKRRTAAATKENCIHCHQLHEAEQDLAIRRHRFRIEDFSSRYPLPQQIGLLLDPEDGTRVQGLSGAAKQAGLQLGDRILCFAGQAMTSIADFAWALQHSPQDGTIPVQVLRLQDTKQTRLEFTIRLKAGWRKPTLSWRASMYALPPKMGLWVTGIPQAERERLGLDPSKLALRVRGLFRPELDRSGLHVGDIVLALDADDRARTASEFHSRIRLEHSKLPTKIHLRVRRGDQEHRILIVLEGRR